MGVAMRSSPPARQRTRRLTRWCSAIALVAAVTMALAPAALAHSSGRYKQRNLVSDQPGKAELRDTSLVNAWGLAFGPTTPAWVADNGTDVSTLYSGAVGNTPVS